MASVSIALTARISLALLFPTCICLLPIINGEHDFRLPHRLSIFLFLFFWGGSPPSHSHRLSYSAAHVALAQGCKLCILLLQHREVRLLFSLHIRSGLRGGSIVVSPPPLTVQFFFSCSRAIVILHSSKSFSVLFHHNFPSYRAHLPNRPNCNFMYQYRVPYSDSEPTSSTSS